MPRRKRIEAVRDYLNGEITRSAMTLSEEQYMGMVLNVHQMMLAGQTTKFIRRTIEEEYHLEYPAMYQLEKDTQLLFNDLEKFNLQIERQIAVQMAKKAYQLAEEKGQVANMIKAQQALVKALPDDPIDLPDFEKIKPSLILTALPPGLENHFEQLLSHGAVNLNKAPKLNPEPAQEIDFEDVSDSK